MIRPTSIAKKIVFDVEKITAERNRLRTDYKRLKARFHTYNKIMTDHAIAFKDMESQLAKSEEALGAIMKIMKRGQAYDVAKQALAELKGEG